MSSNVSVFPLVAGGLTAFALVASLFISADFATAAEHAPAEKAGCSCPGGEGKSSKPRVAEIKAPLDVNDEIAALESVQFALSEVADGSTYVWHRTHGRLSGLVKPTSSFKDANGQVCRHILVVLNGTDSTQKTEAVACRLASGVWQLDG
jgi:surface antigen